ncbi:MAG: hypothetical protein M3N41_01210 [Acidobacteriota bacterium]|nr:hypothetical protein [Acidobacteriota bacterium]
MPSLLTTSTLAILAAPFWFASAVAGGESLDPLTVDPPHYTLEIENQWTRVFREHMGPHDTMVMHQHPLPGSVIVMLTDRHNRLTAPDGTAREFQNKAGYVMWSAASSHRSENLEAIQFEALQIEPRVPPGAPVTPAPAEKSDPVLTDPQHFHLELENEYVRVIRIHVGPHEKLSLYKHPDTKAVVVYLTDYNAKVTGAGGESSQLSYKAKQVRFVDASGAHQEENVSGSPAELIRVELKQAR